VFVFSLKEIWFGGEEIWFGGEEIWFGGDERFGLVEKRDLVW